MDFFDTLKANKKTVSSDEYIKWLDLFMNIHKDILSDDEYIYNDDVDAETKDKVSKLSYFFGYISDLANTQCIEPISKESHFENESYYFYYNNHYYLIETVFGQGSITTIEFAKNKPNQYVELSNKKNGIYSIYSC